MVDSQDNSEIVKELKGKFNIYFIKDKFLPSVLAGDIVFKNFDSVLQTGENRGYLVIDSKDSEIYKYEDGVYIDNGEQRIREIAQWVLGDKAIRNRIMEVVCAVKNFRSIRVKREELNNYIDLVNLKNCILNTDTLETIPHSKEYYFTTKLDFDYDKDAKCPQSLKFLKEVHKPEDIPLIQEIFGYCLYHSYAYNYIFFFIGSGRNGKGTELNLLTALIGKSNITTKAPNEFSDDPFALAYLFGKSANICGDIGSEPLNTTILKRASGMDILNGQYKYGHSFDFVNFGKFVYATNSPPPIKDRSPGIWNRLIFVNFPNKFPLGGPNTTIDLIKTLTTPEELSGLFNWAIIGLQRLKKQGRVSFNLTTEEAMRQYDRKANPVMSFAQDCMVYRDDAQVLKSAVRRCFTEYCKKYDLHAVSEEWFSKKLIDAIPGCEPDRIRIDGGKKQIFWNIEFKNDDSDQRPSPPSTEQITQQRRLDIEPSLEDKINSLFNCLEMRKANRCVNTIEKLIEEGFSESFLNKCIEQGIIHKKPDNNIEVS
jgi:putative DNA primase/helicase